MVQSLFKLKRLLDLFLLKRKNLVFAEIFEHMQENRSTLYNILQTLQEIGYIKRTPDGQYHLGPVFISLGALCKASMNLAGLSRQYLERISERFGCTAYAAVLDNYETVHIEGVHPAADVYYRKANVGARSPLYCTGLGKAILAFASQQFLDDYLRKVELVPFTCNTITDKDKLIDELKSTRKRGYSIDSAERNQGLFCLGVPVFDSEDLACAAISMSGGTGDILTDVDDKAKCLMEMAESLSRDFGGNGKAHQESRPLAKRGS